MTPAGFVNDYINTLQFMSSSPLIVLFCPTHFAAQMQHIEHKGEKIRTFTSGMSNATGQLHCLFIVYGAGGGKKREVKDSCISPSLI